MMFRKHGDLEVDRDQNVICVYAREAWNEETSLEGVDQITREIKKCRGASFSIIADTSEYEGSTPEVVDIWKSACQTWLDMGLKGFVRIDDLCSVKYQLFVKTMDDIFQDDSVLFDAEGNLQDALMFLRTEGLITANPLKWEAPENPTLQQSTCVA